MFPLRWNFPFRKKDGSLSTIQDEIDSGGSDPYVLPIASETRLGGVKIGSGVSISEDGTISVSATGVHQVDRANVNVVDSVYDISTNAKEVE